MDSSSYTSPESTGPTALTATEIQAILHQRIDQAKQSPGLVVGVIDPTGTRVMAYGTQDNTQTTPVDGQTIFEIGSITKVLTSLALVQMSEQHKLQLEDSIAQFLPSSVRPPSRDGREISLQTLATHTSGLPRLPDNLALDNLQNPYADYSLEQLYDFLDRYQLPREIGAVYEYSNLGMGLLGHLLSRRADLDYEALISWQITQPLGMQDTCIQITPAQQSRFATGHDARGNAVSYWDLPTLAGAGALRSTADDLLKFLAANLGLQPSPVNASLQKTHVIQQQTDAPQMAIALGWHVLQHQDEEMTVHEGGTGGFRSFLGFSKAKCLGVVVLSNSENDVSDIGFHLLDRRIPLAERQPPQEAIDVDPKILATYVGRYQLAPEFILTVTEDQGKLYVQATGQDKFQWLAETETVFFLTIVEAKITFIKDLQGQVDRLILNQSGQTIPGDRISI